MYSSSCGSAASENTRSLGSTHFETKLAKVRTVRHASQKEVGARVISTRLATRG